MSGGFEEVPMTTLSACDQDVVFVSKSPPAKMPDEIVEGATTPSCGNVPDYMLHRHAAQLRLGRLRTIEALRRPRTG